MEQENPLGTAKISKLLFQFSVPATVGMVVNALYNIVDRIFIGNAPDLGTDGLAGITFGFPIMIATLAIGLLFGVGGATYFSMKLGEEKPKEADKILGNAVTAAIVSGALILVFGQLFLVPLLRIFGANEAALPYSIEYMRIIFFGGMFQTVTMCLNNFMRADGQPKLAMISMFVGAGTNILLDPLFIYVFGWGMSGAALATIISQGFSMIWVLSYFLGKRTSHRIQLRHMRPQKSIITRIIALGTPSFLLQIGNSLLNVVLNRALQAHGGDIAVPGMGVVNSVQTMLLMPITGINQGVQPIVSFNFGARKFSRIKEVEKLGIACATVISVAGWIMTRLFPAQIVSLFTSDPELIVFGSHALQTWFWCLPVIGFQIIGASFFQAIGRSRSAMFLTLTRQIVLLIPAILLFSSLWGVEGVLYSAPFADGVSAIVTGVGFYIGIRSLSEKSRVEDVSSLID